ncbi:MAG: aspartate aminotransferase family protein [Thermoplasmata archaeon]
MKKEDLEQDIKDFLITSMLEELGPPAISKAHDSRVTDMNGNDYLDCFSGISVTNLGHTNEEVDERAKEQIDKYVHVCTYKYQVPITVKLAKELADITPGDLQKTFFGNSGTEAIETAIKLSRKSTGSHELIALMCSFHGRTMGTLSLTGQANRRRYDMGPYLSGVSFSPAPYCYRCPFDKTYPECDLSCARFLENVIDYSSSGDVAAFIAEPVLGEGGIIVPPPEYFTIVREILDERGIKFIADEVQSGFGRTGEFFGIENYEIEPELMTMAKGIANGYPISACTTTREIGDSFEPGDHLSTFGGNPVSAAAALATIEQLSERDLSKEAKRKGDFLKSKFEEMKEDYELIGDVRGKGLMIGVELVKDEKKPAVEEAEKLKKMMMEENVLIGKGGVSGSVIRIQPPLIITEEEMSSLLEKFETCIGNL